MPRNDFVELCLELLAPLGAVRARRMFGGHGFYVDDLFFALASAERLYLKANAETRAHFVAAGCEPFAFNNKTGRIETSYWSVPAEAMDSPALMQPWARLGVQAAVQARKPAPAKPVRPAKRKPKVPAETTSAGPRPRARGGRRAAG
jgi:DNA transformation protein and related proteins